MDEYLLNLTACRAETFDWHCSLLNVKLYILASIW